MVALARNVMVTNRTFKAGTDHTVIPQWAINRIRDPKNWAGGVVPAATGDPGGALDLTGLSAQQIRDALGTVVRTGGGREGYATSTVSGSALVNLAAGNVQQLVLSSASVAVTLTGAQAGSSCSVSLYLVQDGTGGRSVTWPGAVKWPGGNPPPLSATPGSRDLVVLDTVDGGTTWFATLAGLDFK